MFQKVFNDILSNLEYDNIPFEVVTEAGKKRFTDEMIAMQMIVAAQDRH